MKYFSLIIIFTASCTNELDSKENFTDRARQKQIFVKNSVLKLKSNGKPASQELPKAPPIKVDHKYEIPFGQSAFLSGTFRIYGQTIKNSIQARFRRVNSEGGIQGKMLKLITLPDHGKPLIAKENVETLLKKHNIDMFFGNMGTRSILAVKPMIDQKKIAMFFPWGGNEQLRDPKLSNIINGLGLVEPQIDEIIDHIVNDLQLNKIGIFHSDSNFGIKNAEHAIDKLNSINMQPASVASYNRLTMQIFKAADKLIEASPKIVLCLATSRPTAKLINRFFEKGHFATSFIGTDATFIVGEIMKMRRAQFSYASYMPDPSGSLYKIVKEYRHDIKRFSPRERPNILGLAYYIHATIITEGLKKIEGEITKEKLLHQIESMKKFDLGGFEVDFDKSNRHAYPLQTVFLGEDSVKATLETSELE